MNILTIKNDFQEIREKLLEYKWWELDEYIIDHISPLLCSSNFDELFPILDNIRTQLNN